MHSQMRKWSILSIRLLVIYAACHILQQLFAYYLLNGWKFFLAILSKKETFSFPVFIEEKNLNYGLELAFEYTRKVDYFYMNLCEKVAISRSRTPRRRRRKAPDSVTSSAKSQGWRNSGTTFLSSITDDIQKSSGDYTVQWFFAFSMFLARCLNTEHFGRLLPNSICFKSTENEYHHHTPCLWGKDNEFFRIHIFFRTVESVRCAASWACKQQMHFIMSAINFSR